MKHEVPIRIIVTAPPAGVAMKVQKGRDELLEPARATDSALVFEFSVFADLRSAPNFLGPYVQGPKDARFIYVNSGTYAGQGDTCWSRRAKLSLMSVSKEEVETVLRSPGSRLETSINGVGRDGGPVCASVRGLEWRIAGK
jgi:hypothetical protein